MESNAAHENTREERKADSFRYRRKRFRLQSKQEELVVLMSFEPEREGWLPCNANFNPVFLSLHLDIQQSTH